MARVHLPGILLWLVAIGFFMETLDATVVNTALPAMAYSLGESPLAMQSVIVAYTLTLALFIPASGWMADRYGTKRVFMSAIGIFTLGSGMCALAPNLLCLVLARVAQGMGGSMMMPVGRLAVLRAFPGDRFLAAITFVGTSALIGPLLGPPLGGWLVQYASWHWIFLINIPIGILGCVATWLAMPDEPGVGTDKFDVLGFAQLGLFMVSTSVALDGLSEFHFSTEVVLLLVFTGLAGLAGYILRATRQQRPLFSPKLFLVRTFSVGILGNLFARLGSGSMPFLTPLFLQLCLGYSPLAAGVALLPVAVAGVMAKRLVPRVLRRSGYRQFLVGNTALVGLGIASFALSRSGQPPWLLGLQLFLFGLVNSMQFSAMNSLTLKDLGKESTAGGNSLFSMVQMLAMSFAVALAGALLAGLHLRTGTTADAFRGTFVCMGTLTLSSLVIFWQLPVDRVGTHQETSHH